MKLRHNPRKAWAPIMLGLALASVPALLPSQVSLGTVVDLAQRNSSAVKLAEADVQKARAALAETRDVYLPTIGFGSGLPAVPSVGFSGIPPSIFNATLQSLVFSIPQKHYINAALSGLKAATLSLKDAREQVTLDASIAYIELDAVDGELEAANQQQTFAERLVLIEQERAEAGVDPLSDLLQAQLTAAQLKLTSLHLGTRAGTLAKQLAMLTGLPTGSITPDHASIPEIPEVRGDLPKIALAGIESAQMLAQSKQSMAKGDKKVEFLPQMSFTAQYNRDTTLLNNANDYFAHALKSDNFSSGFSIQVPLFDMVHRARGRESSADALRATVEAEQAARLNEIQIADLTGTLRELGAQAEIASLRQQIADEQLKAVLAQLELGNGSGTGPTAQPQLTPKADQLARIDERQKFEDALEVGFSLAKARLCLLRALGHMEDWLHELHGK